MSNRLAGVCAFVAYLLTAFVLIKLGVQGFGVVRIICLGLLLSNVPTTFLAAQWVASRTEPPPVPLSRTFFERFSDVMPRGGWPLGQYAFYVFVILEFLGLASALLVPRAVLIAR